MAARMFIWPRYVLECGYRRIVFGQNTGRIMARLVTAKGAPVTLQELIEVVCFDREDGGPDWVTSTVLTAIHTTRRRLLTIPYQIVNEYRTGYRFVPSSHVQSMFQPDDPYPEEGRHCGPYKYTAGKYSPSGLRFIAANP